MLSLARKSAERDEVVHCRILPGDDSDSTRAKLLPLVGPSKRVLALGCLNTTLHQALLEQGCEVEIIPATADDAGNESAAVEPGSFDVVLVVGVLEHLHDPLAVLRLVKRYLRREGCVVAAVPNVAHGNVRLALLGGRFPFGDAGTFTEAPLRFFTYDSMVRLFEDAEFGIGVVERQVEDVCMPDGLADALPAEVLESVTQAPEARTAQFLTVAYPLPWRGLGWLQGRMRSLAEQHSSARSEAAALHQDLDAVNCHLRLLIEQQEASVRREKELRAQLLSNHEQMMRRDEEYRQHTAALQDQVKQTEAWWIARLQEANEQLAVRDRAIQQLSADREAQEARLERFRRSLLGRFFKRMRRMLSRG
jgi:SAM-dependent methyltransferase